MKCPWHQSTWSLCERWLNGQLPHVVGLAGIPGMGQSMLRDRLVNALLCEQRTESADACDVCASCQMRRHGTHPDLIRLGEGDEALRVDEVRDLAHRLNAKPIKVARHVVQLPGLEKATPAALNALLKLLEEPPVDLIFLTIVSSVGQLLPTIRSRMQMLSVGVPNADQSEAWLRARHPQTDPLSIQITLSLANGAPCLADDWLKPDCFKLQQQFLADFFDFLTNKKSILAWLSCMRVLEQRGFYQPFLWVEAVVTWAIRCLLEGAALLPVPCVQHLVRQHPGHFLLSWHEKWQALGIYKGQHPAWNAYLFWTSLFLALQSGEPVGEERQLRRNTC